MSPIFTTTYTDNLKCVRNKTNGNIEVHNCSESLKQEEKSTQKCLQDLNVSEELQKTCSAKLNDSVSKINELQEDYAITAITGGIVGGFALAMLVTLVIILACW